MGVRKVGNSLVWGVARNRRVIDCKSGFAFVFEPASPPSLYRRYSVSQLQRFDSYYSGIADIDRRMPLRTRAHGSIGQALLDSSFNAGTRDLSVIKHHAALLCPFVVDGKT